MALWLTSRSETRVAINPEAELADIVTLTERGRLEEAYERALAVRSSAPASPAAANAVSYALTYAGYVDEAARAIDDLIAASPDYMKQNAWWAPTALHAGRGRPAADGTLPPRLQQVLRSLPPQGAAGGAAAALTADEQGVIEDCRLKTAD